MNAVADTRGLKRICTECGARFYDLNKRPVMCPGCDVEFSGEVKVKTRRGRNAITEAEKTKDTSKDKTEEKDELEEEENGGAEIISLDDPETAKAEETPADSTKFESDAGNNDDDEILGGIDEDLGTLDDIESDADLDEDEDKKK